MPTLDELQRSGPISVSQNGQVIENLYITSTGGTPAINTNGFDNVIIRNVYIEHETAHGIQSSGSSDLTIQNVQIVNTSAPAFGANSGEYNSINLFNSPSALIQNVFLEKGSTGIYAVQSDKLFVSGMQVVDVRGPFPRGQGIQLDNSNNSVVENFKIENSFQTSWTEDNVNIFKSNNVIVRNGYIDGNNSPSGIGVLVETYDGDVSSGVLVENVQVVRFNNGAFSAANDSTNVTFKDVYAASGVPDGQLAAISGPNYREPSMSGQEAYFSYLAGGNIKFDNAGYFDLPAGAYWFSNPATVTQADFIAGEQVLNKEIFDVTLPWDTGYSGIPELDLSAISFLQGNLDFVLELYTQGETNKILSDKNSEAGQEAYHKFLDNITPTESPENSDATTAIVKDFVYQNFGLEDLRNTDVLFEPELKNESEISIPVPEENITGITPDANTDFKEETLPVKVDTNTEKATDNKEVQAVTDLTIEKTDTVELDKQNFDEQKESVSVEDNTDTSVENNSSDLKDVPADSGDKTEAKQLEPSAKDMDNDKNSSPEIGQTDNYQYTGNSEDKSTQSAIDSTNGEKLQEKPEVNTNVTDLLKDNETENPSVILNNIPTNNSAANNVITSGSIGEDILKGGDGDDILRGNRGDDLIDGGEGNDYLYGGEGNDDIFGDDGDDILRGNRGDDLIDGGEGDDYLYGGKGNDLVLGDDGDDVLMGRKGDDLLFGEDGDDIVYGGYGDDLLVGDEGNDLLKGGYGDDILDGGEGVDVLHGGRGNDTLIFTGTEDSYDGGMGDDVLVIDSYMALTDLDMSTLEVSNTEGIDFQDLHALTTTNVYPAVSHQPFEITFSMDIADISRISGQNSLTLKSSFGAMVVLQISGDLVSIEKGHMKTTITGANGETVILLNADNFTLNVDDQNVTLIGFEAQALDTVPADESKDQAAIDTSDDLVTEPVMEEPVVEAPVVEDEPVIEEPVVEAPVVEDEPVMEEPVVEAPVVEDEPVVEEPVVEAPVVEDEPVIEEPVVEAPVVEDEPVMEEPVVEAPVVEDEPVMEEPVVEAPVVEEEPVMEEPVVEAPVVEDETLPGSNTNRIVVGTDSDDVLNYDSLNEGYDGGLGFDLLSIDTQTQSPQAIDFSNMSLASIESIVTVSGNNPDGEASTAALTTLTIDIADVATISSDGIINIFDSTGDAANNTVSVNVLGDIDTVNIVSSEGTPTEYYLTGADGSLIILDGSYDVSWEDSDVSITEEDINLQDIEFVEEQEFTIGVGTELNDFLDYNANTASYNGGNGFDTLGIKTDSPSGQVIDFRETPLTSIESIVTIGRDENSDPAAPMGETVINLDIDQVIDTSEDGIIDIFSLIGGADDANVNVNVFGDIEFLDIFITEMADGSTGKEYYFTGADGGVVLVNGGYDVSWEDTDLTITEEIVTITEADVLDNSMAITMPAGPAVTTQETQVTSSGATEFDQAAGSDFSVLAADILAVISAQVDSNI